MVVFVFFLLLNDYEGIRSSSTKQKLLLFGSEKLFYCLLGVYFVTRTDGAFRSYVIRAGR
jgi:hypothetical protein